MLAKTGAEQSRRSVEWNLENLRYEISIYQKTWNGNSAIWDHWIFETLKFRNQATKKLRNQQTLKPRNQQTLKPRKQETLKPRNQETLKAREQDTKKPRNFETEKPNKQTNKTRHQETNKLFQERESLASLNIPTPTPAPWPLRPPAGAHEECPVICWHFARDSTICVGFVQILNFIWEYQRSK